MDASTTTTTSGIKTRILIISDTHGASSLPGSQPLPLVDVAIHCGDLTEESKLVEFQNTITLMKSIDAPLKIVIAGNHDWTLDTPIFKSKIAEIPPPVDMALVHAEYGTFNQARDLLLSSATDITFLQHQGTHRLTLPNGARLTLYASPFTPSTEDWAFQYDPREEATRQWDVGDDVDVVVTHGPPHGVLDRTAGGERIGSAGLFAALRRAKPRLHCFGHVHRGWGAKLVRWRRSEGAALADGLAAGEGQGPGPAAASHFADIDHEKSVAVESLAGLTPGRFYGVDVIAEKRRKMEEGLRRGYFPTSHCAGDERPLVPGEDTLFVNAAIKGDGEQPQHLPWIVDIELPKAP